MLEAVADPNHPNHAEAKEWLDEYDPKVIDELPIKYALSRIANRRMLPRSASLTTSKPRQPLSSRNQPPRPSSDGYQPAAGSRVSPAVVCTNQNIPSCGVSPCRWISAARGGLSVVLELYELRRN